MKIILYVLIITGSYFFGKIFYSNICIKIKFICELKDIHKDFIIKMQLGNIGIKNYYNLLAICEDKTASKDIAKIQNLIKQNKNMPLSQIILGAYKNKELFCFNDYFSKNDIEIMCAAYNTVETSGKSAAVNAAENLCGWLENKINCIKDNELSKVNLIKKTSVLVGVLLVLLII